MYWLIVIVYLCLLTFVLLYSITQLFLAFTYLKGRNNLKSTLNPINDWPTVTIQLPIFNESLVVDRLLSNIVLIDYPKELLEIQILDDSNDETLKKCEKLVDYYRSKGIDIVHITRDKNIDYKAGALKLGMKKAKGDFLAIFDSDFLPKQDFLKRTIPFFNHEKIGVVQTCWGHINQDYSALTKIQALVLNAHFSIEQVGRSLGGDFINFNGTAGVWRKSTIIDSGGWQGDTITEDLDLSYRAQLKGWEIKYLEEVVSPAELPPEVNALKSQQYRWAKGAAECARKNLKDVFKSNFPAHTKWHAFFHLTNSLNWVCLFGANLLLIPFLFVSNKIYPESSLWSLFMIFHISFICLFVFYWIGNLKDLNSFKSKLKFILYYPAFLTMSMGISLNTSLGVVKGYLGRRSEFVRTPKFNILNKSDKIVEKSVTVKMNWINLFEMVFIFYSLFGVYKAWEYNSFIALPFVIMQAIGFFIVSYSSIKWSLKK